MLNAAFVRIVPWGSVALRANLLSAVFAILACLVAVVIFTRLGVRPVVAAGGATALGLIPQLWHFALIAEVYTLSILFVALVLGCLLAYDRTERPAWLRAGLLIFALSFAHATSQVLLIPGLLLYLAVRRPAWLFRPRELARLLPLGAALALLPYAYLLWRTAAGAPLLDTRVTGLTSFWEVISGARYSGQMFGVPLHQIISERLPQLWSAAIQQFGVALLVCALGLLMLIMQRPLVAAVTGLWLDVYGRLRPGVRHRRLGDDAAAPVVSARPMGCRRDRSLRRWSVEPGAVGAGVDRDHLAGRRTSEWLCGGRSQFG